MLLEILADILNLKSKKHDPELCIKNCGYLTYPVFYEPRCTIPKRVRCFGNGIEMFENITGERNNILLKFNNKKQILRCDECKSQFPGDK